MNFLSRLMPREGQFFDLFNRHAQFIVEGSGALCELLRSYESLPNRESEIARIQTIEQSADKITHETVALLHRTFVTPLDRDDIHRLISRMDDVLDLIQDTAEALLLYDIQRLTPEAIELTGFVQRCCERVHAAVRLISSMDNAPAILKICQEIDALESECDLRMRAAISKLFRDEQDVKQLIKLQTVYELLEEATDRCQDVADVIEGVVLENA
jgi:predicted phosphate transport protein (TIGR00153 family)